MRKKTDFKTILMVIVVIFLFVAIGVLSLAIQNQEDPLVIMSSMASEAGNNIGSIMGQNQQEDPNILLASNQATQTVSISATPRPTYANTSINTTPSPTLTDRPLNAGLNTTPTVSATIPVPDNTTLTPPTTTYQIQTISPTQVQTLPKAGITSILSPVIIGGGVLILLSFIL
jgi:hypothetical protein